MKIEHHNTLTAGNAIALDIKHCYLPISITDDCPACGASITKDLSADYISYPRLNTPISFSMHHIIENEDGTDDDEHHWEVKTILRVTMEAVTP